MLASSRVWALVTWLAFVVVSSWIVFRADYRADISAFLQGDEAIHGPEIQRLEDDPDVQRRSLSASEERE